MLGHESGKMLIQHYRELVKPREAALLGTRAAPESKIVSIVAA